MHADISSSPLLPGQVVQRPSLDWGSCQAIGSKFDGLCVWRVNNRNCTCSYGSSLCILTYKSSRKAAQHANELNQEMDTNRALKITLRNEMGCTAVPELDRLLWRRSTSVIQSPASGTLFTPCLQEYYYFLRNNSTVIVIMLLLTVLGICCRGPPTAAPIWRSDPPYYSPKPYHLCAGKSPGFSPSALQRLLSALQKVKLAQ